MSFISGILIIGLGIWLYKDFDNSNKKIELSNNLKSYSISENTVEKKVIKQQILK